MSAEQQGRNGADLRAGVSMDSLAEGVPVRGHVDGEAVILVRRGGDVCAVGATCTHYGGPLADGLVVDDTIRCPWHHACFSLRTGEAVRAPALTPVPSYDVVRRDGSVYVAGKREQAGTARRHRRPAAPGSVAIVGGGAAGNSAHYDVPINDVGHAARWDAIEVDGSIEGRDCAVRYRAGDRVLAVASIFRDRESLKAELAMERGVAR